MSDTPTTPELTGTLHADGQGPTLAQLKNDLQRHRECSWPEDVTSPVAIAMLSSGQINCVHALGWIAHLERRIDFLTTRAGDDMHKEAKLLANERIRNAELEKQVKTLTKERDKAVQLVGDAQSLCADALKSRDTAQDNERRLREAIVTTKARYPVSVFPEDGESMDCEAAKFARVLCDDILALAENEP